MNPWIDHILVCEYASVDNKGRMNAVAVFDRISLDRKEKYVADFFVVGKIRDLGLGKHSMKISIVAPNGKEVGVANLDDRENQTDSINLIVKFKLIEFSQPGKHLIKIYLDGGEIKNPKGDWELEVVK